MTHKNKSSWLSIKVIILVLIHLALCAPSKPANLLTIGFSQSIPQELSREVQRISNLDPAYILWSENTDPDILIGSSEGSNGPLLGQWTYAVVAPFFTVTDTITSTTLKQIWNGNSEENWSNTALLMTSDTFNAFSGIWGKMTGPNVQTLPSSELLTQATASNALAIIPFHQLTPKWKLLRVDGISLLEKSVDPSLYPLNIPFFMDSETHPEILDLLSFDPPLWFNRKEDQMTILVMTGVTAMTRRTALLMEESGITYPAKDIKSWFSDSDFVHISNEVSFEEDYVAHDNYTLFFSSNDRYIELLEEINTNVIELTGNHLLDKGVEPMIHSFDLYKERGWQWYGGGENKNDAYQPLLLHHGGNKIALFGCNTVDGPDKWATDDLPGVATCRLPDSRVLDPVKLEQMGAQISALKAKGYQILISLQYYETYEYKPYLQQISDFRTFADLGADYVQGSQAHQAQTMEFHNESFIHYGLGNLFFDQMWSHGTRQEFVNRLTFYDGQLISIDLRTAFLEENGRPRPMTIDDPEPAADRKDFLKMIFDLRPEDKPFD